MELFRFALGALLLQAALGILQMSSETRDSLDPSVLFHNNQILVEFWPYQNASRMCEMIKIFASRFSRMYTKYHANVHTVVSGVATYNRDNHNENSNFQPLRVYIGYNNFTLDSFKNSFYASEIANGIFEGSVAGFIFIDNPELMSDTRESLNSIKTSNHSYHLALAVHSSFCTLSRHPHLLNVFGDLDLFQVWLPFRESYHVEGVDSAVKKLQEKLIQCQQNFKMFREKVRMSFYFEWSDTNALGTIRNQSELVRFWIHMAQISNQRNMTMFIIRAFDSSNPSPRDIQNSNGWWTRDWREKMHAPEDTVLFPTKIDKRYFSCDNDPIVTRMKQVQQGNSASVGFDRSIFSVVFKEDFVHPQLTRERLVPFVGATSERFSKLMFFIDAKFADPRLTLSAGYRGIEAAAIWNKFTSDCISTTLHTMEISLALNVGKSLCKNIEQYEEAITSVAVSASFVNNIFRGTVRSIVLVIPSTESTQPIYGSYLRTLRSIVHSYGLNFTVIQDVNSMENPEEFIDWKRYVFTNVDFVYIRFAPCADYDNIVSEPNGLNRLFESIKGRYEEIVIGLEHDKNPARFGKTGLNIDMAYNCSQVLINQSDVSLFWVMVNKYATKSKSRVLLSPAISSVGDQSLGWWRVSRSGPYYTMTESLSAEDISIPISDRDESSIDTSDGVALWTSIPILLVFILAISVIIWICFRNRRIISGDVILQKVKNFHNSTPISENPLALGLFKNSVCLLCDTSMEIESKDFLLDSEKILGSGNFGYVLMAEVFKAGQPISVAAKTLRFSETVDDSALRSLLMEIKISSYLGRHENITQLVGAYTREANVGKVYAFFELAHLGSLQNFLRKKSRGDDCAHESSYIILEETEVPMNDLYLKWSLEIAEGMEYIGSKFIVHGDLATRNVLLNKHMVAKISDFGLSRRMENYQNYVKSGSEPLPWRWMAFESLKFFEFSVKSDVWSYGVTLWEIFSDGGVPYPGLNWTPEFATQLEQGMRLPAPTKSTASVYALMRACWMISIEERPTFTQIKEKLSDIVFES